MRSERSGPDELGIPSGGGRQDARNRHGAGARHQHHRVSGGVGRLDGEVRLGHAFSGTVALSGASRSAHRSVSAATSLPAERRRSDTSILEKLPVPVLVPGAGGTLPACEGDAGALVGVASAGLSVVRLAHEDGEALLHLLPLLPELGERLALLRDRALHAREL